MMNESVLPRASIRRSADKVRIDVSLSLPDSTKCTLQKRASFSPNFSFRYFRRRSSIRSHSCKNNQLIQVGIQLIIICQWNDHQLKRSNEKSMNEKIPTIRASILSL